jgi:osmoprotectant transport system permease protein
VADGGEGLMDDGLNLGNVWLWLNDPANWHGPDGIITHLREQIEYSLIAVVIAVIIAIPLGLLVGHTGRGVVAVAGTANALRAIPTFGLVVLLVVLISPHVHSSGTLPYLIPAEIVLVLLALPPIIANTYAGVQNIDPAVRDAAAGMGMTPGQVVLHVELPNALPLMISGVRSATLQVIATSTVAAYVSLGGLGRFLIDGLSAINDPHDGYPKMAAGALLVALLALVADLMFALVARYGVSRGVSERFSRGSRHSRTSAGQLDPAMSLRSATAGSAADQS